MKPATAPRERPLDDRLLWIDPHAEAFEDRRVGDLVELLRAGDLMVVNDAATLPASLAARAPSGRPIELRLAGRLERGRWRAVVFGEGDWRTPTEHRPQPEPLAPGATIALEGGAAAIVERTDPISSRLVELRFDREGAALWRLLLWFGRPVQYSYLTAPLPLWAVQNGYAARPWAMERPSAGRPLPWGLLTQLAGRGVALASITHAAGLSSTGDPAIDAALPLPERYSIPARTVERVAAARARGGRVVAVGTSVVRALEGAAELGGGVLAAGEGITDLRIRPGFRPRIVDGLFTGLHEPTASHSELLTAFAPQPLLTRAYSHADQLGYLAHELGDSNLILGTLPEDVTN